MELKAVCKEITVEEADEAIPGGLGREADESAACSAEFGWGQLILPWDVSCRYRGCLFYTKAHSLIPM